MLIEMCLTRHAALISKLAYSFTSRAQSTIHFPSTLSMSELSLQQVVNQLDDMAPLKFAESWDNVGLLIEPFTPKPIKTIFLTNDLTEKVLKEALGVNADLIISYHPPIFASFKRITKNTWKERLVAICLENRLALYSPHTSWDCVKGGICDWLCGSLPYSTIKPITPHSLNPEFGLGRYVTLQEKLTLREAIALVKAHTGIKNVHVAMGADSNLDTSITTAALCAGSGASVLKAVTADLLITGEMSHHEVLDFTQRNISVILCNHSNSERGFLKVFKNRLDKYLDGKAEVIVTKTDADPLETY